MKKMFFGSTILLCGTIGLISIIVLSVNNPWDYNGITGIYGFLLGSQTLWAFILFCLMFISGAFISFYEAYFSKVK
ncbi:hypothetical protein MHH70_09570 [Metasolibacillus sp. FSL H7-0170]|uniref:hypothetical protein n=1 Tax=Metasolibacillus TaxID=2703677 RepID=UPI0007989221|nr:hypothetical protein [Metasolibacillus fluoroglycofenilyticus]KYG90082.1 hypothetical protein A0U40_07520 [[Bacillus] sp. KCTC 13219]